MNTKKLTWVCELVTENDKLKAKGERTDINIIAQNTVINKAKILSVSVSQRFLNKDTVGDNSVFDSFTFAQLALENWGTYHQW